MVKRYLDEGHHGQNENALLIHHIPYKLCFMSITFLSVGHMIVTADSIV